MNSRRPPGRTRIKICGLTRAADVEAAVALGADAIGLVFYAPSPRHVSLEQAARLVRLIPPFVEVVGLFVNAEASAVHAACAALPISLLQFHGDETPAYCRQFARPYLRAARVRPGVDLLEFARSFSDSRGLLLDAFVAGYGGGGVCFDWRLIPSGLPLPVILSGGLDAENVGEALAAVRPAAVDVSSGVEEIVADQTGKTTRKGFKDHARMAAFVAAVKKADDSLSTA